MQKEFFEEFHRLRTISVRVLPGAKKTEVCEKMENGVWKIKVAAPPEDGRANVALFKFLKKQGKIEAEILHGAKDRKKTLTIKPTF